MDATMDQKAEYPTVYVGETRAIGGRAKLRRFTMTGMKLVFMSLFLGVCLALVYKTISGTQTSQCCIEIPLLTSKDKQNYDKLLAKYNRVVQDGRSADQLRPTAILHRAVEAGNLSYTYTTTTLTKGTTVTLTTTPSTTVVATTSSVSSTGASVNSSTVSGCGSIVPQIVTVTVHDSIGAASYTASSSGPASMATSIIALSPKPFSTRVTTTTILVTASSSAPPETQTATLTSTAVIVVTATELATAGVSANSGVSASTVGNMFGSLSAPSHFPNRTSTAYGSAYATTVNYTMTVPPIGTGTAKLLTTHGTTTSRSDPVQTVMSASGDRKVVCGSAIMLSVVLMAFIGHI
ncbi:hypothetical protein CMQ_7503 [Grosmannia clavigera kw1407]|uniref:Uncharacterized protein n=1 Tax=Grosmannia clavigera (strain kw1407 / UAMH 11150) TaxID=655863 RepID=F0XPX9_GROCL|nr:uncharacterized protein CMQ_7503 [Grosmannia clavigera kw1407]EFX00501.1 hypothetical protein CMQ_7503 [Grosmannia clavigera kw1407]